MAKQTITYDPQVLDLLLYAGDGVKFSLVVTDASNAPIDLTGDMLAQIRTVRDAEDPQSVFNVDMSSAVEGIAVLSLTGQQTSSLLGGTERFVGVWDLQWTATDQEPVTLCQGKVECAIDVSR